MYKVFAHTQGVIIVVINLQKLSHATTYIPHTKKNRQSISFSNQFDAFFGLLYSLPQFCLPIQGGELVLQKQARPKLKPKSSSLATKSSRGNQSGSPERVKSVLELLSCRGGNQAGEISIIETKVICSP